MDITDTVKTETSLTSVKSHRLFDILLAIGPAGIALLINEGLLDLAKVLWQMSATKT